MFAILFSFLSYSISYASFDFQGDYGAKNLEGRGDHDDDDDDHHGGKKKHCFVNASQACSECAIEKGLMTLCREFKDEVRDICLSPKASSKLLKKGKATLPKTYYPDADLDGFGDSGGEGVISCLQPAGTVDNNLDCDDTNPSIHPNATEVCDSVDNDCDGNVDNSEVCEQCLIKVDLRDSWGDGFNNGSLLIEQGSTPIANFTVSNCGGNGASPCTTEKYIVVPKGSSIQTTEKPDAYPEENSYNLSNVESGLQLPGISTLSPAWLNGRVLNYENISCSGDCPVGFAFGYRDIDGDGYGAGELVNYCNYPGLNFVLNNDDCDDNNPNINPGATESCDDVDNNCDGTVDNDVPGVADCSLCACWNSGQDVIDKGVFRQGQVGSLPYGLQVNRNAGSFDVYDLYFRSLATFDNSLGQFGIDFLSRKYVDNSASFCVINNIDNGVVNTQKVIFVSGSNVLSAYNDCNSKLNDAARILELLEPFPSPGDINNITLP